MAQPTALDVHIDVALTNISLAYIQQAADFVATKIFPMVPVSKQTDKYFTYTKNDWFRDEAQVRAPATESAGSGYGLSTASYACVPYAFHKDIPDQVRDNADVPIDLDREATFFVTQRMLLRQEIQWASDAFKTGVWGTDSTPSNLWSNYTTSDPLSDVETGKSTILQNTGYLPNTMVMGYQVWQQLRNHPDIVDRIKYTSAEPVTEQLLARLFGIDRILVARAIKATNNEGETAAYSFVFGKNALLAYVAPSPGILTVSAGYTFVWQGVSQGYGTNIGVSTFRLPRIKADRVEAEIAWANQIVASDVGYFFNGAVS